MKFGPRMGLLAALVGGAALPAGFVTDVRPAAPGLDHTLGVRKPGRSKGAQAKPKKRPNMLLVSKRVRRKHRRKRA